MTLAALSLAFIAPPLFAADHTDPPTRVEAGDADDIGDVEAWHDTDTQTLSIVLTFAGPLAPTTNQQE